MKDIFQNKFLKISFSGKWFLALFAVGMVLAAGIGSANAYFTTYAEARGGVTINLGDVTDIEEEFEDWTKHIVIDSMKGSEPVWVRVKAFCGSEYRLVYEWEDGWSKDIGDQGFQSVVSPDDEGFYYYTKILYGDGSFEGEGNENVGGKTTELLIQIKDKDGNEIVSSPDAPAFNVVVIYECTPVLYNEDGEAYADWTRKIQTGYPEEKESEVSGDGEDDNQ